VAYNRFLAVRSLREGEVAKGLGLSGDGESEPVGIRQVTGVNRTKENQGRTEGGM